MNPSGCGAWGDGLWCGVLGTTKVDLTCWREWGLRAHGLILANDLGVVFGLWRFGPCDHGRFLALGPGVAFLALEPKYEDLGS